ncbi:MAG: DUF3500 domain-containing protein [Planctomycetota bacterium]
MHRTLQACRPLGLFAISLVAIIESASAHGVGDSMAETAVRFLASLEPDQRLQAALALDAPDRAAWSFFPAHALQEGYGRPGVALGDLRPDQRLLAHKILKSALAHRGYLQALTVMTLEQALHEIEDDNPHRDAGDYRLAVFGEPTHGGRWAWRFEGHHLSINLTLDGGHVVAATPSFFGSNPARVTEGALAGTRALAAERDLALELVRSLSPEQRSGAIVSDSAPADLLTRFDPQAERSLFGNDQGILAADLTEPQRRLLRQLVAQYTKKYRPPVLEHLPSIGELQTGEGLRKENTRFAWAGSTEPGQPCYYRVVTPSFVFEFDTPAGNANHVHSVWRAFDGDFGRNTLAEHYRTSHRSAETASSP